MQIKQKKSNYERTRRFQKISSVDKYFYAWFHLLTAVVDLSSLIHYQNRRANCEALCTTQGFVHQKELCCGRRNVKAYQNDHRL